MDSGAGKKRMDDFESLTDEQKSCIQEITTKQTKRIYDDGDLIFFETLYKGVF